VALDSGRQDLLERANRALGRLDGVTLLLPDLSLFLYFYVRKEAVLSSQIEGTQSSLSDLLLFESEEVPGVPFNDVMEVSNYVAALNYGVSRIRGGAPLTSRLIRDIHAVLMQSGRGSGMQPGEFRRSQNWLGGTRPGNALFVPPPPEEVGPSMTTLEKFLHDVGGRTPTLLKAAMAHVQFETIHPFLDGNGRVGRLLIPLLLCYEKALAEPLLYLSLYLKQNRAAYYELLQRVRTEGEWEEWIDFFLDGVRATADQAAESARQIVQLFAADHLRIEDSRRASASLLRLHYLLQRRPLLSIPIAAEQLGVSRPTASASLSHLVSLGLVSERSGRKRDRLYAYDRYLALLEEGTERQT
jgi:Fic family protein